MGQLTTHDVLEKTSIDSSKTLTRWHQRGLIPPPSIETHPNGRGKIAYWPIWIVNRIQEVKTCLANGELLDDIANKLGQDWAAEQKRWARRRPDIAAAFHRLTVDESADRFAELVSEWVYKYLRKVGVSRPGAVYGKLWKMITRQRFLETHRLVREGHSPLLVVRALSVRIVKNASFDRSITKRGKRPHEPFLVVPLHAIYQKVLREHPELEHVPP